MHIIKLLNLNWKYTRLLQNIIRTNKWLPSQPEYVLLNIRWWDFICLFCICCNEIQGNYFSKLWGNIQQQNMKYHNTETWNVLWIIQAVQILYFTYEFNFKESGSVWHCVFVYMRPAKDHGFLAGGIVFPLTCTRWPAFLSGPHPDFDLIMIQLKAVLGFTTTLKKGAERHRLNSKP